MTINTIKKASFDSAAIMIVAALICMIAFMVGCSGPSDNRKPSATTVGEGKAVNAATGEDNAQTSSAPPSPISFPKDDAPHKNKTEWWYYNGNLTTGKGANYGFHYVIFQRFIEE